MRDDPEEVHRIDVAGLQLQNLLIDTRSFGQASGLMMRQRLFEQFFGGYRITSFASPAFSAAS
jgi:hypothetical protein